MVCSKSLSKRPHRLHALEVMLSSVYGADAGVGAAADSCSAVWLVACSRTRCLSHEFAAMPLHKSTGDERQVSKQLQHDTLSRAHVRRPCHGSGKIGDTFCLDENYREFGT